MPQFIPFAGTIGSWAGAGAATTSAAMATGTAIIASTAAVAGTAGVMASQQSSANKAMKATNATVAEQQRQADAKSTLAAQEEAKTNKARAALLSTPTLGFGPNTNLARSFLTSL